MKAFNWKWLVGPVLGIGMLAQFGVSSGAFAGDSRGGSDPLKLQKALYGVVVDDLKKIRLPMRLVTNQLDYILNGFENMELFKKGPGFDQIFGANGIYSKIGTADLEINDKGPCLDKNNRPVTMSIHHTRRAWNICVSVVKFVDDPNVNGQNYYTQLLGQLEHEYVHLVLGDDETTPTAVQKFIVENIRVSPIVRDYATIWSADLKSQLQQAKGDLKSAAEAIERLKDWEFGCLAIGMGVNVSQMLDRTLSEAQRSGVNLLRFGTIQKHSALSLKASILPMTCIKYQSEGNNAQAAFKGRRSMPLQELGKATGRLTSSPGNIRNLQYHDPELGDEIAEMITLIDQVSAELPK